MRYLYSCKKCGEFEVNLMVAELPLEKCPTCEGVDIKRVYKPITTIYKTGGFYSTDK